MTSEGGAAAGAGLEAVLATYFATDGGKGGIGEGVDTAGPGTGGGTGAGRAPPNPGSGGG